MPCFSGFYWDRPSLHTEDGPIQSYNYNACKTRSCNQCTKPKMVINHQTPVDITPIAISSNNR